MRKSLVLAIAVVVGLVIAARPRDARACGGPVVDGEVVAAVLVVTGAYAGTTIGMAYHDLSSDDPSRGYGVAEAVIHTPIALGFGAAFIEDVSNKWEGDNDNSEIWLGAFTALHATLAIHGMYTAGKYRKPRAPKSPKGMEPTPRAPLYGPPSMVNVGSVRANVTLTPVSDGRTIGAGSASRARSDARHVVRWPRGSAVASRAARADRDHRGGDGARRARRVQKARKRAGEPPRRRRGDGDGDTASLRAGCAIVSRARGGDRAHPARRRELRGAREARVMTFIERQLAIEPFVRLAPGLIALARGLDAQASARGPGQAQPAFAQLDVAAQDQVLEELARGGWPDRTLPQRELFVVLHSLTLEGFLADPNHGGNHGGAGWKAIDFAEPPLRTPGAAGTHGGGHGHGP